MQRQKQRSARKLLTMTLSLFPLVAATLASPPASLDIMDAVATEDPALLQSLAGRWEFQPWPKQDQIPDFNNARQVNVPGHALPGAYRTTFTVNKPPVEIARTVVHFGAVGFRCAVYVNGQLAGRHLGGYTPFAFDITPLLATGENQLVVLVQGRDGTLANPESDPVVSVEEGFTETGVAIPGRGGRSIIGYGYFAIEGIRQPVHIRHIPALRIADTALHPSYRERQLKVRMTMENQTGQERPVMVQTEVFAYEIATGEIAESPVWTDQTPGRLRPGTATIDLAYPWSNPRLWMLGDPHLYVARFSILDPGSQQVLHHYQVRFGFREIWTEGNRIMLNGRPIRGFVHGTLDTQIPAAKVRELFEKLLATNINMVRPATMPPAPHYAKMADEMGLGLVGEGELTFNRNYAFEQPAFWENFERVWQARIQRDKNHPSILVWSLANEVILTSPNISGLGQRFFHAYQKLRKSDPTRPFMQEGDGDLRDHTPEGRGAPIDIINMHFYNVSPIKNPLWATEFPPVAWALEDVTNVRHIIGSMNYGIGFPDRNRPWFIGEFGPVVLIAYPDHFAFWTGPDAYRDLFGEAPGLFQGVGETMAMQIQAFRDVGMAAMDPWAGTPNQYLEPYLKPAMSPVLAFTRDWRKNGFGSTVATRDFTILNDSLRPQRLRAVATLDYAGRERSRQARTLELAPGERYDGQWEFNLPATEAKKTVRMSTAVYDEKGQELTGFSQDWQIFPAIEPNAKWRQGRVVLMGNPEPLRNLAAWSGLPVVAVDHIERLDVRDTELVVIDFHSYHTLPAPARERLDRFVQEGGVLLNHEADLFHHGGQKLEAAFTSNSTRVFLLDPHPLTAGTTPEDWQFWHPDHLVSQANYNILYDPVFTIPLFTSGAAGMRFSPLVVKNHGRGAYVLSRLRLNAAVNEEPMARIFLNNAARLAEELAKQQAASAPRQVALLSDQRQNEWKAIFQNAGLEWQTDLTATLAAPNEHLVFLPGNAAVDPAQLSRLRQFVQNGGVLWLHRLTPQTPFLDHIGHWLSAPLVVQPALTLPTQFEVTSDYRYDPLLAGITDYHTCWITFAWTHGDRYSIRTRPIADYTLTPSAADDARQVLLREPTWHGEWQNQPGGSTIAQELMFKAGQHRRHEEPAGGLIRIPLGNGLMVIDQVKWDETIANQGVIPDKARRYLVRLGQNLTANQ